MLVALPLALPAQTPPTSPFDGSHWGVVLEHPDTKKVVVSEQIPFHTNGSRTLHMDVYLPPSTKTNERRPTIILLNGIGDQPGSRAQKASSLYTSWGRLLAANGFVAITMESEVNNTQTSFDAFFNFVSKNAANYNVDETRIGVQAFSANCRQVVEYLKREDIFDGIQAAVLYYGQAPAGPFPSDLPVLFIVAELDIRGTNYATLWGEVLRNNSPWTITVGQEMPHAFDAFSDSETSRRLILSTISFWKNQLQPVPPSSSRPSEEREIVASRYDRDASRFLQLMGDWMKKHPQTQDAYALSLYGTALLENKQFAEAGDYLKKSIAVDASMKGTYLNLALVSYALGKTDEATSYLTLYEKGSTPEGFTYWYIANRLIGISQFEQAAALYVRALTFPSQPSFVHYNLAACYAMMGNKDSAFEHLLKAAEMKFGTRESYEGDAHLAVLRSDARWDKVMVVLGGA